jgi:hypothetical protein
MPNILTYGLGIGGGGFEENAVRFSDMKDAKIIKPINGAKLTTVKLNASIETKSISAAIVVKKLSAAGLKPKIDAKIT